MIFTIVTTRIRVPAITLATIAPTIFGGRRLRSVESDSASAGKAVVLAVMISSEGSGVSAGVPDEPAANPPLTIGVVGVVGAAGKSKISVVPPTTHSPIIELTTLHGMSPTNHPEPETEPATNVPV